MNRPTFLFTFFYSQVLFSRQQGLLHVQKKKKKTKNENQYNP